MCAIDWKCAHKMKKTGVFFRWNSRVERARAKTRPFFGIKSLAQPPIQPNQTKPLQSIVMTLQSAHEINAGIESKDENLQSFVRSFVYEYVKRIYMALLLILLFDNGNGCLIWFDFIENWGNSGVCVCAISVSNDIYGDSVNAVHFIVARFAICIHITHISQVMCRLFVIIVTIFVVVFVVVAVCRCRFRCHCV